MSALYAELEFWLGDTWAAPEAWAVFIDDADVDLSEDDWIVTAQARSNAGVVLAEWSTANGRVLLGRATAEITINDVTSEVETSTVQLRHSAVASTAWSPFAAEFDCQIERGDPADPERYTIAAGTMRAHRDQTRA